MSIQISESRCVGCGSCVEICPGSLIKMVDKKAIIMHGERCWGCASCVKECPVQAISLFLGEDMGGLGGKMTVRKHGTTLNWIIKLVDGTEKIITTDSRNSNKY